MAPLHSRLSHRLQAAFEPRERRLCDQRGFTLFEALIATAILAGGMLAVAQLLGVSLLMHQLAQRTSEASELANARIETLMRLNFDTAPEIAITPASPDALGQDVANHFDTTTSGYTRRWKVEAGPVANTRTITLRVIPRVVDLKRFRTVEVVTILRRW